MARDASLCGEIELFVVAVLQRFTPSDFAENAPSIERVSARGVNVAVSLVIGQKCLALLGIVRGPIPVSCAVGIQEAGTNDIRVAAKGVDNGVPVASGE